MFRRAWLEQKLCFLLPSFCCTRLPHFLRGLLFQKFDHSPKAASTCWSGLANNSILFGYIFTIKDNCIKRVSFTNRQIRFASVVITVPGPLIVTLHTWQCTTGIYVLLDGNHKASFKVLDWRCVVSFFCRGLTTTTGVIQLVMFCFVGLVRQMDGFLMSHIFTFCTCTFNCTPFLDQV